MLSVSIEDRKGGYIATKHLLEEGHRDIGFAGPSIGTSSVIQNRYQGYLDALKEYHIEPNPHWIFDKVMRLEGGVETAEKLLKMRRRPTAMFTTEDIIACGIMKGYQNHGLHLPEDISLVGFDNSMPSTVVTPMLTSVNQFIRKKAETAVSMLLKAIQDPEYRKDQVVIGVDLVKRDSVLHIAPTD